MTAVAMAIALVASIAAISPASADLYDDVADGVADIRLQPDSPTDDSQDQEATVLQPGATGQAVTNMQVFTMNQWRSGDRILVQLFDAEDQNCAAVPDSIGFTAAPAVGVAGPYEYDPANESPWDANNGSPDVAGFPDDPAGPPDTAAQNTLTEPTFNVEMLSSTGCDVNGITDIMSIQFTNQSSVGYIDPTLPAGNGVGELDEPVNIDNTDTWVFTISGVELNVGTQVAPGPIHAVPFGQDARPGIPAFENTTNIFGGNQGALQSGVPLDINVWTVPAFVVPVTLDGELAGSLVADDSVQPIGEFTFGESQADGWMAGNYEICFTPGIEDLQNSPGIPLQIDTTPASLVVTPTITGTDDECVTLNISNPSNAALESITVSNIFGRVTVAGTQSVQIEDAPAQFTTDYLTPDDQDGPGDSMFSDVNLGGFPLFPVVLGPAQELPDRIGGNNRYETAAKIALFDGACADFAVLAAGNSYPDALSANYLAGALGVNNDFNGGEEWVPILTTPQNQLSPHTIQAIRELGVRTVYIVGGTAAISAAVQQQVEGLPRAECGGDISDTTQTVVTQRYSGANRYLTNKAAIQAGQNALLGVPGYNNRLRYQSQLGEPSKRTVLVASGDNFADALSAGPYAYGNGDDVGFPLVLTTQGALSSSAADTMTNLDIEQAVIVGGTAAVSPAAEAAIQALGVATIRISGPDRYITNALLNGWALTPTFGFPGVPSDNELYDFGLNWSRGPGNAPTGEILLARGDDYADALAVAPLVGWEEAHLVLTTPTSLHPAAAAYIGAVGLSPFVGPVIAIGLGSAITTATLDAANAALNP